MKRLVVCADGTWNTLDQEHPTNVAQLRHSIVQVDDHGVQQRVHHQGGVGTRGGMLDRILGGALGWGLDDNIISIYRWLIRTYEPNDEIWLFGFSRGAYTARSLAGLLGNCGLASSEKHIARAMEIYRRRDGSADTLDAVRIRSRYAHAVRVRFVGVFDTVGSLGIPTTGINLRHRFHDVRLSSFVRHARHALAIDEQRLPFEPTLWDNTDDPSLKQVWFVGAHSNVGGGLKDGRLADIALAWMMDEAHECGLGLRREAWPEPNACAQGDIHHSHAGFYALRARRREIRATWFQSICRTAVNRMHSDETYEPENLVRAIEANVPILDYKYSTGRDCDGAVGK